jgi:FkbM family methyltransferase
MLIDPDVVRALFKEHAIAIKGVFHVGAHKCEEKEFYNSCGVEDKNIVWVDANPMLTADNIARGIPNCYTSVMDEVERDTTFHITNNNQSSSLLEFGTHAASYPWCVVTKSVQVRTETMRQFFSNNSLDPARYNVWNFDIQGVELQVFRGSKELLQYADVIYAEVNTAEVYKGCGKLDELDALLKEHGLTRVLTKMTDAHWGDAIYVRKA